MPNRARWLTSSVALTPVVDHRSADLVANSAGKVLQRRKIWRRQGDGMFLSCGERFWQLYFHRRRALL